MDANGLLWITMDSNLNDLYQRAYDMDEVPYDDEFLVSQRDRISVDVSDIREQVENCRNDVAWTELPLAAKLRVLIKERLEQLQTEMPSKDNQDR
jgi:hypothetical protein